jgi:hypothetical protein
VRVLVLQLAPRRTPEPLGQPRLAGGVEQHSVNPLPTEQPLDISPRADAGVVFPGLWREQLHPIVNKYWLIWALPDQIVPLSNDLACGPLVQRLILHLSLPPRSNSQPFEAKVLRIRMSGEIVRGQYSMSRLGIMRGTFIVRDRSTTGPHLADQSRGYLKRMCTVRLRDSGKLLLDLPTMRTWRKR